MFGPLTVVVGGHVRGPADFGGVKPKQVLELLALARGHLVSKDALADALWADELPKNAAATLETYISVLRRSLGPDRAVGRRLVVTAPGAYRLATDELTLDLARFDQLHAEAQRDPARRRELLTEALDLVHGDLLEDEPYAPWVQEERALYRTRIVRSHLAVAADALADGDPAAALRHGELALRLDTFDEQAWRAVMLAHRALGHGSAAGRALARCRVVLADELGIEPSPETVAAGSAPTPATVAGGRASRPAAGLAGAIAASSAAGGGGRDRRSEDGALPFLGRRAELAHLSAAAEAASGRFVAVLVEGRSGMGRTRLLDELVAGLDRPVGRTAHAAHDVGFPTVALGDALGRLARGADGAGDLVADVARYAAEDPWTASEAGTIDRLAGVLRALGPVAVLLDDVQWADPTTLDAVTELGRRHPDLPVLVVASARSDVPGHAELVARLPHVERLVLDPLTRDDVPPDLDPSGELLHLSGGTPLLLADLHRWSRGRRPGPSPSLVGAIKRHVADLGPSVQVQLQVAAALPEPFDAFDVAPLLERPVGEVSRVMLALTDLGCLRAVDGGFGFREPIVRQVLDATLPLGRRLAIRRSLNGVPADRPPVPA